MFSPLTLRVQHLFVRSILYFVKQGGCHGCSTGQPGTKRVPRTHVFFVFNGRVIRVGLLFEIDELILDILFTDKDDRNQITHDNGS